MNLQLLKETLLTARARTYCVLDGAAVKDLPRHLYEMKPPNYCLLRGELTPDMVHVAPYVALMIPGEAFSDWVVENCFGANRGIFVQTRFSIKEMRKHFRALITVLDEKGDPMLFRFYDPRVFRKFLPTCDGEQIETFFGSVDKFFLEDEDQKNLLCYTQTDGVLEKKEIDLSDKE
jgi:hypothetical protein